MRKLALGIATAAALITVTAVPAMAQFGFYAGPGGIGFDFGTPYYGYYGGYPYGYYNYYGGPGVAVRIGPRYRHVRHWRHYR